ncbi:uncharacterized protein LOC110036938 [Phalaenopsis equestris]|uniref:uncharacterized protein LOC110036938 n=1 Tax=Phalaenopsis equestris TaxID=78828 RepID=UPI0009E1DE5E|nr:uncharacterized protein LOC110036938 [Phalaenopsis equestris]
MKTFSHQNARFTDGQIRWSQTMLQSVNAPSTSSFGFFWFWLAVSGSFGGNHFPFSVVYCWFGSYYVVWPVLSTQKLFLSFFVICWCFCFELVFLEFVDNPIDIVTDAEWAKATYAGVVGKYTASLSDPDHLVFPQNFHDTTAGKVNSPCIHSLGIKEGELDVYLSPQEIHNLNEQVKFTLVGKFLLGHPKMELVTNYFASLKFNGDWHIGILDGRHLLIQLSGEEVYARLFAKQDLQVGGTTMKILKWDPDFDPCKEPHIVPLWFKLPGLPIQYFNLNALFNIASAIGRPLKLDAPTYNKARPALARTLIERDVTFPEIKRL